jgi:hypothetical protein
MHSTKSNNFSVFLLSERRVTRSWYHALPTAGLKLKRQNGVSMFCSLFRQFSSWYGRVIYCVALLGLVIVLSGCNSRQNNGKPAIKFTRLPQTAPGTADKLDIIQGQVEGAHPGQQIVLYVKTGAWWLQPLPSVPFTKIQPNSTWINSTHMGSQYAALLVEQGYHPQAVIDSLPALGNGVVAVTTSKDEETATTASNILQFSGYEWRVRNTPSSRGDQMNNYSPANAWTDDDGALHLRIAQQSGKWTCAELALTRNLGYGQYSFVVRDTSSLVPGVAFTMFTWDYAGVDQNNREMAIEISRLQDPQNKNAQYVVQPYHVAANVTRFTALTGRVTHSFRWEPEKLSFKTVTGSEGDPAAQVLGEHVFTSGIPSPGVESIRLALYIFGKNENQLQKGVEVIIEKFEYLP